MKDKIVLVTGGNGMLGKEMVNDIARKGAFPLTLDVNIDEDLNNGFVNCDITNDHSIKETINKILNKFGRIDGLVNNAYPRTTDWGNDFENIEPESWRKNVDWQLNAHFVFCQEAIKVMKKQEYGSIVNIASTYGVVGNDLTIYEGTNMAPPAAYTAIKGGMINFTRYLASKFGHIGIRVNCVSPGGIFNNQPEPFVEAYNKRTPLKRMGNPDDIAPAVSFLLSDEAKYITGHNLMVDGGWTAI